MGVILFFSVMIGAVIGSFCNMLIYRLPRDQEIVYTRSHCPHCQQSLNVLDLVPLLSFIGLLGRCRHCKEYIGGRYFVVEVICTFLWAGITLLTGFSLEGVLFGLILTALVVVFFTDMETQIIPDSVTIWIAGVGAVLSLVRGHFLSGLAGILIGFGSLWVLSIIGKKIYGRDVMGGGDIKLAGAMGLSLGLWHTLGMLYASFMIGGIVAFGLIVLGKKDRMALIAFGPFLIGGYIVVVLWGKMMWHWYASGMFY